MPTYDYKCDACGHTFEQFQSITANPLKKCPDCGKSKLKRLMGTGAGLIFKGAGFYQTDYRSEGYKKAAESEKPSTETKSADKTDSAPAAKAETKTETKTDSSPKKLSKPKKE